MNRDESSNNRRSRSNRQSTSLNISMKKRQRSNNSSSLGIKKRGRNSTGVSKKKSTSKSLSNKKEESASNRISQRESRYSRRERSVENLSDNPIYDLYKSNKKLLSEGTILVEGYKKYAKIAYPTMFSDVNEYGMFIGLFKKFVKQPFIRKFLVSKYNPIIPYANIRFDSKDKYYNEKIQLVKTLLEDDEYKEHDFILDIAQELTSEDHGKTSRSGHYTSLKREHGVIEYMDSDPFYYGNEPNEKLNQLLAKYDNPAIIYGDNNKCIVKNKKGKSIVKTKHSIQNVNKFDYFCQSWSLLYITIPNFTDLPKKLKFTDKTITHENTEKQKENFPKFIENFNLLINFWITIFGDSKEGINKLIKHTQFVYWEVDDIIQQLKNVKEYIENLMNDKTKNMEEKYEEYIKNISY
jgi:hypothetical protein